MKLGLKNNEVKLVPFDKDWVFEFQEVKKAILAVLDMDEKRVEHIGSTAINGIPAKPIIDIILGVDDLEKIDKEMEQKLRTIGFYRLRVKRPNEVVFAKFLDETFEIKTHFIHAVVYQDELWENLIFFRNYLNEYNDEKMKYAKLKADYLQLNDNAEVVGYTNYKEDFVKRIYSFRSTNK